MIIDGKALEKMKSRNCGNCHHRNERYKILGCDLHNKQVKKEFCCSSHSFPITDEIAQKEMLEKENQLYDSSEICKYCKKPMKLTKNGKRGLFDDDNTWIYECHNEECEKQPKLIIDVCEECEDESRYWEE